MRVLCFYYCFTLMLLPSFLLAQTDIESVYMLLSGKLDTVTMEMAFLRKQLRSIRSELDGTKVELKDSRRDIAEMSNTRTSASELASSQGMYNSQSVSSNVHTPTMDTRRLSRVTKALQAEKALLRRTATGLRDDLQLVKDNLAETATSMASLLEAAVANQTSQMSVYREQLQTFADELQMLRTRTAQTLVYQESNDRQISHINQQLETTETAMQASNRRLEDRLNNLNTQIATANAAMQEWNKRLEDQLGDHKSEIAMALQQQERCQSGTAIALPFTRHAPFPATSVHHFNPPFRRAPALVFGPKSLDVSNAGNTRYNAWVSEITGAYFKFTLTSWADTVLYSMSFNWMACPK